MPLEINAANVIRFWTRIRLVGECWIWTGRPVGGAYGCLRVGTSKHKTVVQELAHRFSWRLHHGQIPLGMEVCHNCPGGDNPLCVNPGHLFLGTHADNMADASQKGMLPCGEKRRGTKLTAEQAIAIRELYASGTVTQQYLASEFGVTPGTIYALLKGITWHHI